MNNKRHTFAICAYKESPYLEACIRSLKGQSVKTDVICCTSTPNQRIETLTKKYDIPLFIRDGESGIREDWLFAYHRAEGALVTIAHQDDIYGKNYAKCLLESEERYPDMTVFMSDYLTLKETENGAVTERFTPVWLVKRILRLPIALPALAGCRFLKRSAFLFGNSVCCPSCTYHKRLIGDAMFQSAYDFALDWDNLYELAGRKGRFVCVEKPLIAYRIHPGATTKACIEDHRRTEDEIAMFEKMWPRPMVRVLMHFYRKAYGAYNQGDNK